MTLSLAMAAVLIAAEGDPIRLREFVYERPPTDSCHASTIVESGGTLVAAWFGGTEEGAKDVGVWLARREGDAWSSPVRVAGGEQADGRAFACYNPVLHRPKDGPLLLFYKVGPSPSRWWGMLTTSVDHGKTWAAPRRLPDGTLGPIKNKPIVLADGTLLCPSSTEHDGWRVHFETTTDLGRTWKSTGPIEPEEIGAIQPTILTHADGRLQALCRARRIGKIVETWSDDNGKSWSPLKPIDLPNPDSGIDATTLKDGRFLLVYNPTVRGRTPLKVTLSRDGKRWNDVVTLEDEPGEYSYPAIIQTSDGLVHVTYTWKRERIRHVVIDPAKLR